MEKYQKYKLKYRLLKEQNKKYTMVQRGAGKYDFLIIGLGPMVYIWLVD